LDAPTFAEAVKILERNLRVKPWSGELSAFETLIITILSQSTADVNTRRAFERLKERFDVKPEVLARARVEDIRDAIRSAGLYNMKAPRIKAIAKIIMEKYGGDLENVLRLPLEEAREKLLELPGVGGKTADILLNFIGGYEVFPIDTHIMRVSKRLGLVREKAGYEEAREKLEEAIPGVDRRRVHFLLIQFGREICKAIRPRCEICPLTRLCEYYKGSREGLPKGVR